MQTISHAKNKQTNKHIDKHNARTYKTNQKHANTNKHTQTEFHKCHPWKQNKKKQKLKYDPKTEKDKKQKG